MNKSNQVGFALTPDLSYPLIKSIPPVHSSLTHNVLPILFSREGISTIRRTLAPRLLRSTIYQCWSQYAEQMRLAWKVANAIYLKHATRLANCIELHILCSLAAAFTVARHNIECERECESLPLRCAVASPTMPPIKGGGCEDNANQMANGHTVKQ